MLAGGPVSQPEPLIGQCPKCFGNLTAGHECGALSLAEQMAPATRHKASYIGAPAVFALEQACQHISSAFGGYGCYVVGSSLERADWRDVDVRLILSDEEFEKEFPDAHPNGAWEFDPRWLLLTVAISDWLKKQTGLPVDFQFQPQSWANSKHKKRRNPIGLRYVKRSKAGDST